jgi:hypothetical protein
VLTRRDSKTLPETSRSAPMSFVKSNPPEFRSVESAFKVIIRWPAKRVLSMG